MIPSTRTHPEGAKKQIKALEIKANSIPPSDIPETILQEAKYFAGDELESDRLLANRQMDLGSQFKHDATFTITADKEAWILVGLTRSGRKKFEVTISTIVRRAETEDQEERWPSFNKRNTVAEKRAKKLIEYLQENESPWWKFWESPYYEVL